ncbi:TonB-linked SusC/RagA family outer membrane protein [Marinilabilia salmonicolor]|jgi:TonB-linked SusC/RagA family outer membrane protein|uniref:SusC/RagA family TonB-linked outer membrane protein n=1 Tax=Marinilabilia salmonicolor TaxID=989 RepID=UPI000D0629A7|nr:SusC/RagA family TonB-linked outer membrane protein [Marinilabilia salmonicolor]PRZ00315.1 TonB-linked SusC/RagA family outer membrane protein [Marinilabilia salmonicolor]
MKKVLLALSFLMVIGLGSVLAQAQTISGTVTGSETGEPVPGVSVFVKGTTIGTVTNIDGAYSLNVPEGSETLVFSFIGMQTQEIALSGQTTVDLAMVDEAIAMDEVVVTALGISREKKSLGYAAQNVNAEELTAANNSSPISALAGKVAGVQISGSNFAGSQNVLIRGASSLTGNNQPLYVVDGVPLDNQNFNTTSTQSGGGGIDYGSMVNDLNSYDIESVNILKGSAASALYGSRGQNGVIMITTKSGTRGRKDFSVEVNSGVTFEEISVLPPLQREYGGGYGGFGSTTINGVEYQTVSYDTDESWGPRYEGQQVLHWWGISDYEQGITSTPQTGEWKAPENDVEDFFETGVAYQNSVSVSTSSENSALRVGYSNVNKTGTIPNSSQDKHTFNINGSSSFFDEVLEVKSTVNYVDTYTKGRPIFGYHDNSVFQKFFQWGQRQLDMDKLSNYKNPDGTQRTWNRISVNNPNPLYSDNPYWTVNENYSDDDRKRIYGTAGLKINITDYLSAEGNVYLDTYTFNTRERVAPGSQALSAYESSTRQFVETNYEGKISFNDNFGDLNLMGTLGANRRVSEYNRVTSETDGGLAVGGLWNVNNSNNMPIVETYKEEREVNSWFAMASVGYRNLAYVDITARKDFDSTLPNGDNSYFYPAASFSFIPSEVIDVNWMNFAKVRFNISRTGNGTDPYRVIQTYLVGDAFNNTRQFSNNRRLNYPDLKPESTSEIEFGLEGAFLANRVGFDFSWYKRNTTDQIVPIEISGSTGFTSKVINAGEIENKGVEVLVYGTPVKISDFQWDISVNYSKNDNEVVELPAGLDKLQIAAAPFGGAYLNASVGDPYQMLWGYDYVYDDSGNKIVDPDTGFYQRSALKKIGSALPDYNLGIRNAFKYKNFDVSVLLDIQQGGTYYSLSHMWGMYSGMLEATAQPTSGGNTIREDGIVVPGVLPSGEPNDITIAAEDYGAYHYHGMGTPSATSFFDASYVKLREVTFGYTLPKFADFVEKARVSFYGQNLFVWGLDQEGVDPESTVGGSGNIQGMEGGLIPATRSYGMNVQITF